MYNDNIHMSNMNHKGARERRESDESSRRRVLRLLSVTSIATLAGCASSVENGDQTADPRPDDWCVAENDGDVPEIFETAESVDGIERNPEELTSREEAAYQCHPQGYQLCANCRFFIPSRPAETDGNLGACAIVEGRMRSQDWCALYQETEQIEEFPHPEPLEESGVQKPPQT